MPSPRDRQSLAPRGTFLKAAFPRELCRSPAVSDLAAGFQWVLLCRLLLGLPAPALTSSSFSCASDTVKAGRPPILCPGPWGCGPNTTKTFFSFVNVLAGAWLEEAPSDGGSSLLCHICCQAVRGVLPTLWRGERAGEQANG